MGTATRLPDWSLIQSFLAVADNGSLSAAARQLGHSQPTLGRHIKTLEDALGVELFHRHARGYSLTAFGVQMLPAAQGMASAMAQISLVAEAEAQTVAGTVRIACSVFAAHHLLPPIIATIREQEPAISVVVQASDDSDNLLFREADIALRMYRPRQLDLVTRHVLDIPLAAFASHSYVRRRGHPRTLEDLQRHDIVGYDQLTIIRDAMAQMGMKASIDDFPVRTDNQTAYWELVRAGAGIGFCQAHVGRADAGMVEIDLDLDIPALPVWLTAHETVRRTPRVSRVWTLLDQGIQDSQAKS